MGVRNGERIRPAVISSLVYGGQRTGPLTSGAFDTLTLCQAGDKAVAAFPEVDRSVRFVSVELGSKTDAH